MLAQIKPNLADMTEKLQANDVQRRQPVVVRCCLKYIISHFSGFDNSPHELSVFMHELSPAGDVGKRSVRGIGLFAQFVT